MGTGREREIIASSESFPGFGGKGFPSSSCPRERPVRPWLRRLGTSGKTLTGGNRQEKDCGQIFTSLSAFFVFFATVNALARRALLRKHGAIASLRFSCVAALPVSKRCAGRRNALIPLLFVLSRHHNPTPVLGGNGVALNVLTMKFRLRLIRLRRTDARS